MPIIVSCECGKQFQTSDENAGRRARCPDCGRELIVPKENGPSQGFGPPGKGVEFVPGAEERTSGKAITSLVLGILSFFCCLFTGIPAIIFGMLGISDVNAGNGRVTGKGMAIAGIITGVIGCFGTVLTGVALLLPAVQAARAAAQRAQCVNNLKQMGLAMHNYVDTFNVFPPAAIADKDGKPLLSWRVAILPFVEQDGLFKEFHLDEPWDSPHNKALVARMPGIYRCPSEPQGGDPTLTSYQVIVGPGTLFESESGARLADITDGTSNTLMVVESTNAVPWTRPDDIVFDPKGPRIPLGSKHPGGANALFADGSVKFLKSTVNDQTLTALITRAGGEVVNADAP